MHPDAYYIKPHNEFSVLSKYSIAWLTSDLDHFSSLLKHEVGRGFGEFANPAIGLKSTLTTIQTILIGQLTSQTSGSPQFPRTTLPFQSANAVALQAP